MFTIVSIQITISGTVNQAFLFSIVQKSVTTTELILYMIKITSIGLVHSGTVEDVPFGSLQPFSF